MQSLTVSECCNPGRFAELAGEFGMLPGIVVDVNLMGHESQEPMDMTKVVNQQRYEVAPEDQGPYLVAGAPPCARATKLTSLNRGKHEEPRSARGSRGSTARSCILGRRRKHPWDAKSRGDPIVREVVSLPGVFLARGDMRAWGLGAEG